MLIKEYHKKVKVSPESAQTHRRYYSLSTSLNSYKISYTNNNKYNLFGMWSYIEPSELKEILLTQSKNISQCSDSDSDDLVNSRVAILDVRDDDFPPTKIVGARNIPSEEWGDDEMIDSDQDDDLNTK